MQTKYFLIYWAISILFVGLYLLISWKKMKMKLGPQIMMIKGLMPEKAKNPLVIIFVLIPLAMTICLAVFPFMIIGLIIRFLRNIFRFNRKKTKTTLKVESEKISEEINIDFNIDEK